MRKWLSVILLLVCFLVELLAFNLPNYLTMKEQIDLFCLYTSFGFFSLAYSMLLYVNENKTEKYHLTYKLIIQYIVLSTINSLIDELGIGGSIPTIYQLSEIIIFIVITIIYIKKLINLWQKTK